MSNIINIESLSRAAQTYNPVLQTLPFEVFEPIMRALGINVMEVSGKDTIVSHLRKGNIARPYNMGIDVANHYADELGKTREADLEVHACVAAVKDHIKNYQDKNVITNAGEKIDNKSKKHPLERLILEDMLRTIAEDVISALFPAERDITNLSPQGMLDGFDTIISAMISASEITAGKGNYIELGDDAFASPVDADDTTAYDNLVKFVRSTNRFLRKRGLLYLPDNVIFAAQDALGNKLRYKGAFEFDMFLRHLQSSANAPGLKIATHECLGTGDRIMMTIPGNLDLGVNTKSDMQFVQIRAPFEDPNYFQGWSQWELGARVRNPHEKLFAVSDGTPVADLTLSGDYS